MIALIDNYDSFTYNLLQYLSEVSGGSAEIRVVRNDAITVSELAALHPSHIIISPGPCTPTEAGISLEIFRRLSGQFPVLGVCLGHQALGQAFGGTVTRARYAVHGKTSMIHHDGEGIFSSLPSPFAAARYHSLVVEERSLPAALKVTAWCNPHPTQSELSERQIMALQHREFPNIVGVQFHPESILTAVGKTILANFLATNDFNQSQ